MTDNERREAVRQFINRWHGRGNEDEDGRSYWIEFLSNVLEMDNPTERVDFEKKVVVNGKTKRIDVYIPETHVIIEQKSLGKPLDQKIHNSDDVDLTPYEQAKRYNDNLPYDEKARWIITCNFSDIWVYDMNARVPEPVKISLDELQSKYVLLEFLVKKDVNKLSHEMEVSIAAGEIVGLLYDAFYRQYEQPVSEQDLKDLNVLCVRLVFCLYAEDAGIFGKRLMFHDYLEQFDTKHTRKALKELFEILDTKLEDRDKYLEEDLAAFPYVNGGLFAREDVVIPQFTDEIRELLLTNASADFDWSQISPTIFGAVFESTLNPETRRLGGMHYTSIENIHKVIEPLFLNDLKKELEEIKAIQIVRTRVKKLHDFQDKLASLKFLDPACGSGNFLTETYISLRRLENETIKLITGGQMVLGEMINPVKVSISQFYGIEINDFAVTVGKTALWIAESQMLKETEDIVHMQLEFLPLKTNAYIAEGNALKTDWESVVPKSELNYIMGNPPFLGYSMQNQKQKDDILSIYVDENGKPYKTAGKIDYVSAWYFKASQFIQNTNIRVAFVSTNSITQGEQVASVWEPLYNRFGIHIDFAYRTFIWDSEASLKAHVHCVVIGFSYSSIAKDKVIYSGDTVKAVNNISPYLIDAPIVFIDSRSKPLCDVPQMSTGNRPADGGHLIIEGEDYDEFISKEPNAKKYIKKLTGAVEYINNKDRYCLWLVGVEPSEIRKMPEVMKRVEACREDRLKGAPDRQKLADTPMLFRETKNPQSYIIVPATSSERRRYIPLGFLNDDVIPTNAAIIIPNATLFHFGVLTSNIHMAWMRAVCGRLKSDYRYSKDIVYNNFPWCNPTEEQKANIEQTAQGILDARAIYQNSSLADLYDSLTMPIELRKAHVANDKAVMASYGFGLKMSESECVAELFKLYQQLAM